MGREEPRKKLINLGFISLGAVVLIILAYFGLAFYQSNIVTRTQEVRQERLDLDKQISDLKNQQDASIDYKRKLEAVKNIISHHVYWSKFFEKLEEYTIKDVYYVGAFNGVLNSTINLSAETNNFTSVAEQLIVFQNAEDFVSEVIITGAKKSGSGSSSEIAMPGEIIESFVTFSISLKLVPSIFYELIEEEEVVSADSNVNSNTNTSFSVNTNTNSNTITDNNSNTNTNTDFINNSNTNFNSNINTDFNFNTNSSL